MELDVVDLDALLLLLCVRCRVVFGLSHQQAVVNSELALGHAGELGLDNDLADDVCLKHGASVRDQNIDVFHNVDEQLVEAVLDVRWSPRYLSCSLYGDLLQFLNVLGFLCF